MSILCLLLSACVRPGVQAQNIKLAQIDVNLALVDVSQQEMLLAKSHLLKALALAPNDAHVLAAWGYYLAKVADISGADHAYQQALMQAPQNPELEDDYAVFLYQQKKYAQALHYFLLAAGNEQYLYSGLAYQNASLAAAQLGETALAETYHAAALRRVPELLTH